MIAAYCSRSDPENPRFDVETPTVVDDLKPLRDWEVWLYKSLNPGRLPNKRPTTAKNGGSEHIFRVLLTLGVDKWEACSIIAEMLIEAGIGNDGHEKAQRALYDKFGRPEDA